MKQILRKYKIGSDQVFFEMIAKSFKNEDKEMATILFNELPKANKHQFCNSALGYWNSGIERQDILNLQKSI